MAYGRHLLERGCIVRPEPRLTVTHKKELTFPQLLRVNFRKAAGTARLTLRTRGRLRFARPVAADWGFLLGIPLTYLVAVGTVLSAALASRMLAVGTLALLLLSLLINRHFFLFLQGQRGIRFTLASLPLFWSNFLAYGLGIAWGAVSFLFGVRY
jgi:hypothetical protein